MTSPHNDFGHRLMVTCQLHDFGVNMMRQRLRKEHPDESDDQIAQRLGDWLMNLPRGARVPLRLAPLARRSKFDGRGSVD